jgi:hypothetical protein
MFEAYLPLQGEVFSGSNLAVNLSTDIELSGSTTWWRTTKPSLRRDKSTVWASCSHQPTSASKGALSVFPATWLGSCTPRSTDVMQIYFLLFYISHCLWCSYFTDKIYCCELIIYRYHIAESEMFHIFYKTYAYRKRFQIRVIHRKETYILYHIPTLSIMSPFCETIYCPTSV